MPRINAGDKALKSLVGWVERSDTQQLAANINGDGYRYAQPILPRCFSKLRGFQEMAEPHQRFHRYGVEAVTHFHAGHYQQGIEAIAEMEKASFKVLESLETIAESGKENINSEGYQECHESMQATKH